jgi:hypothetical protein
VQSVADLPVRLGYGNNGALQSWYSGKHPDFPVYYLDNHRPCAGGCNARPAVFPPVFPPDKRTLAWAVPDKERSLFHPPGSAAVRAPLGLRSVGLTTEQDEQLVFQIGPIFYLFEIVKYFF